MALRTSTPAARQPKLTVIFGGASTRPLPPLFAADRELFADLDPDARKPFRELCRQRSERRGKP